VLVSEPLIDGSSHHPSDFVTELLNLGERRIRRRPLGTVAHCCHSSHALIQLFLRLIIQND
jgi:hypothetical protein